MTKPFANPFRPGAGHMPPYLAGREKETQEFQRLLKQEVILDNVVLTGLRGVGKTVLLDTLKPLAIGAGWLWVGTDLSESASLSEERIAVRLLADLSVVTSSFVIAKNKLKGVGFVPQETEKEVRLNFQVLSAWYAQVPGLVSDKLRTTLEMVWECLKPAIPHGLIFAYDEAQNLADHTEKQEYPLSLLLDVFQSIQKKNIPFMLVLVGLPTLFPKLVEARTFAERMFHVIFLERLEAKDCKDAILKPIAKGGCPVSLSEEMIQIIATQSGGYPYFIQFICREVYDVALQKHERGEPLIVPINEITRKLDMDFFAGRWARATDRQRELMWVIAHLETCDKEFTIQEVGEKSKEMLKNSFSPSHVSQMLVTLSAAGLVYRNRHGRYSFAVPLLGQFIRRQPNVLTSAES